MCKCVQGHTSGTPCEKCLNEVPREDRRMVFPKNNNFTKRIDGKFKAFEYL